MTERLYYRDSFLYEFDGKVVEVVGPSEAEPRTGVVLDRTAFYPTSGGQVHDLGQMKTASGETAIKEVAELTDGRVVHFVESPALIEKGNDVHGIVDAGRRRDHVQQHSGQHVLSAAFVKLFQMPTVSFHMGEEACSIDLDTASLSGEQVAAAQRLANEVILENRPVEVRYVSRAEAERLGLRKLPPADRDELRLVEIADFDLCACGGTHVSGTGQVGSILLRKMEKVKQGCRVEFVCGLRAVETARRDYAALVEAGSLLSSHIWDVPQQVRKSQEEARRAGKGREELLVELAELMASGLLAEAQEIAGRKVIVRNFADRDAGFVKLLAQKATRLAPKVVALVASEVVPASVVFASSPGLDCDMGATLKKALTRVGGHGGGSKEFAQGGVPAGTNISDLLNQAAKDLGVE
jgi:alanyl-tRNA synthetase